MAGIQDIPHIVPEKWSAQWFRTFIAETLSKLDARNSVGQGISIASTGNSVATISVSDWISALDRGYPDRQSEVPVLISGTIYRVTIGQIESLLRQPIAVEKTILVAKGHTPTIS